MKIDKQVIIDELEKARNGFIEIDIMCDAYKTEMQNRQYNSALQGQISDLETILKHYDELSEEEWDELNHCFYYGYKVKNKETGKETILYKKKGDRLYLLNGIKVGRYYKNDFTKEEIREKYDYVRNPKTNQVIMDCQKAEKFISYRLTAQKIEKYLNDKEDEKLVLDKIKEICSQKTGKYKNATFNELYELSLNGFLTETLENLVKKSLIVEKKITYKKNNEEKSFFVYELVN